MESHPPLGLRRMLIAAERSAPAGLHELRVRFLCFGKDRTIFEASETGRSVVTLPPILRTGRLSCP